MKTKKYQYIMKHAKEWKSAGPSGAHRGHWIAAADSDEISNIYAMMMAFPFQHEFAPKRWENEIDVILEK